MAAQRDNYTWHLRAPFDCEFDRARWWEAVPPKDVHPIAALYELVRRHPRVGELRTKFHNRSWHSVELKPRAEGERIAENIVDDAFADLGMGPKALHCLCLIGLKSWPQLDARDQEYWMMSGGRLKGVDCRDAVEQCTSLTAESLSDLLLRRVRELNPPPGALKFAVAVSPPGARPVEPVPVEPDAYKKSQEMLHESLKVKPLTPEEMEQAVADNARSAHRAGNYVFSVAPDLTLERATELLSELYRRQQESDFGERARARWTDWLPAVSEFEAAEVELDGAKSDVFTRYRRILEGIDFEPHLSRTQKLTGWT